MPTAVDDETTYVDAVANEISEKPDELEVVDTCHCIVPVLPLNVNVLAVPKQVPPAPLIVPATDVAFTTTAPENALVTLHEPIDTMQ